MRLLLSLLLYSLNAQATIALHYDLPTLVERAEVIAIGRVEQMESRWEEGRIHTRVKLKAEQLFKGERLPELDLLGGAVKGIVQRISGSAHFELGERVLLFLSPARHAPVWRVVGMSQGKFQILDDPSGARLIRRTEGLSLVSGKEIKPGETFEAPLQEFLLELSRLLKPVAQPERAPTPDLPLAPGEENPLGGP